MRNRHHVVDVHDVKSLQQFLQDLNVSNMYLVNTTHSDLSLESRNAVSKTWKISESINLVKAKTGLMVCLFLRSLRSLMATSGVSKVGKIWSLLLTKLFTVLNESELICEIWSNFDAENGV